MASSSIREKLMNPVTKTVTVSGDDFEIRQMPALTYSRWLTLWGEIDEDGSFSDADRMLLRSSLILAACLIEDGETVFNLDEYVQVAEAVPVSILSTLADACMSFNGLAGADGVDDPEEAIAKNS